MNVIIVGAGEIGFVAADTISQFYDVLVIERDSDVAESLKGRLNVSVLHEDGTNPKILAYAIENHRADIIVSTLRRDDSNLFVCLMAKRIKPDIMTVASVTDPDFMIKTSSQGEPGVDVIISPEIITARKMFKLCTLENAVSYEFIDKLGVCVAIYDILPMHQIIGKVVMNLDMPEGCTVFAIYRDDELFVTVDSMEIHVGDKVCVFGSESGVDMFNSVVGITDPAREFMILGGSIVGMNLARMLKESLRNSTVHIIEKNPEVCMNLNKVMSGVDVVNSDFTDPDVQMSENVFRCDCTVSTSHQDDTNLLMCMTAQKYNARKIITRYFKKEYEDIFRYTGLETIIGYYKIVSNEITKFTISDEAALLRLKRDSEFFFTQTVKEGSKIDGKYLGDLSIPDGIRIVAIRRGEQILYPTIDTRFQIGDVVIVFTNLTDESDLARVFGKRVPDL